MKVIYKEAGKGRTTELVRMSSKNWTYIVVPTPDQVRNIVDIAHQEGLDIPYPLTLNEVINNKLKGSSIKEVLIDNADQFVREYFLHHNINYAVVHNMMNNPQFRELLYSNAESIIQPILGNIKVVAITMQKVSD